MESDKLDCYGFQFPSKKKSRLELCDENPEAMDTMFGKPQNYSGYCVQTSW
jgi:hypothetical protein